MNRSQYLWTCIKISLKKRLWAIAIGVVAGFVALWALPLAADVGIVLGVVWALMVVGYVALRSWARHRNDWVEDERPTSAVSSISKNGGPS